MGRDEDQVQRGIAESRSRGCGATGNRLCRRSRIGPSVV